jgi:hypothetical protein
MDATRPALNLLEKRVRIFYSEIWQQECHTEISNLLDENFVFCGLLGQNKKGHSGFEKYVKIVHTAL